MDARFREALEKYADEQDLPLTMAQVRGLARTAVSAAAGGTAEVEFQDVPVALTPQQLEMLRALAGGEDSPATARRLCRSVYTIKTHKRALYKRLGARSSSHAVTIGVGLGLIKPTPVRQLLGRSS
ncbi:response regulator transcription factor [Streptomyces sp. NPDC058280]|uniref:response regulator transcription factor n=1 Tax=Streptomyces sp. NPDC058280 TaxID=3346419 RepID=UPI0036E18B0A